MGKKLCQNGEELKPDDKKLKYLCKKCNRTSAKENRCCRPVKLKKTA
jgi:hypothetical protein